MHQVGKHVYHTDKHQADTTLGDLTYQSGQDLIVNDHIKIFI